MKYANPLGIEVSSEHSDRWSNFPEAWSNETQSSYLKRYRAQDIMLRDDIGIQLLTNAFQNCNKLQHVRMTEYRRLARQGDAYTQASLRMCGSTVPPSKMFENKDGLEDIHTVIAAVMAAPNARLYSFIIGT